MDVAAGKAPPGRNVHLPPAKLARQRQATSPVSLTASDGTGLELTRYHADVVIEGPLSFTQLELTFHNPEARPREGRFSLRLPGQAAVSRFAMRGPDGWQEAEVVERRQAQLIYEDYLHRRVDPALMENSAGNEFSARVFPIAPGEYKQLIVSFSSELDGREAYVLPLRGLPRIADLTARVRVLSPGKPVKVTHLAETGAPPQTDLVVPLDVEPFALQDGNLALLRLTPRIDARPALIDDLTVLFDTSASRMLNLHADVQRLSELLERLGQRRNLSLQVFAFDQEFAQVYEGPATGFGLEQQQRLLRRRALGASDLLGALSQLQGSRRERVLLVTDAVATAGEVDALLAKAKSLRLNVGRIDVLLSGGLRDEETAQQLARSVAQQPGIVADLDRDTTLLMGKLQRTTHTVVPSVPGAQMILPPTLESVQPGDTRLVYVALDPAAARSGTLTASLSVDGKRSVQRLPLVEAQGPLLRRAGIAAQIRQLQSEASATGSDASALERRVVELSVRHRVLSNRTAMLVLESDADYARYGLARDALADILAVGPSGVELLDRKGLRYPAPSKMAASVDTLVRPQRDPSRTPQLPTLSEAPRGAHTAPAPNEPKARSASPGRVVDGARKQSVASEGAAPPPAAAPAPERSSATPPPAAHEDSPAPADDPREHHAERSEQAPSLEESGRGSGAHARPTTPARRPQPPPASEQDAVQQDASEREADPVLEQPLMVARSAAFDTSGPRAVTGTYAEVQRSLLDGNHESALAISLRWLDEQPGEALALLALGESLERMGDRARAARAYGSLIDLYPARADLRRFAATLLDRLSARGHWLAVDSYEKARKQRPDHLTGYRLEAYALAKQGRYGAAIELLLSAFGKDSRIQRAAQSSEVLRHDLSLLAAAWLEASPKEAAHIRALLAKAGVTAAAQPTTSFVLSWETDQNDVDLHVLDGQGGHAYYRSRHLPSGGSLLEDVTRGYGPELFVVQDARAFPYELGVHYYSRGPMGYGMGRVEIIRHDGRGGLRIETRPFVIMNDGAKLSLGRVE